MFDLTNKLESKVMLTANFSNSIKNTKTNVSILTRPEFGIVGFLPIPTLGVYLHT